MIEVTRTITEKIDIDEETIQNSIIEMLFEEEINDNGDTVADLPFNAIQLIFRNIGQTLIEYTKSEEFMYDVDHHRK
jgi:hypothetical protein